MTTAVRTLLSSLVDYAGLFPPAALPMEAAVAEYARQRSGADSWILGRFVVPAARLAELAAARRELGVEEPWPISVLAGAAPRQVPDPLPAGLRLESLELKADSAEEAARVLAEAPEGVERYVEIPWTAPLSDWIAVLGRGGGRGKIRCGGVTADAIPSAEDVGRFLWAAVPARLPFKATAGLHHPLRGEYRLTYEDAPPRATMHGYVNLFLAAALVRRGGDGEPGGVVALLDERSPEAFRVRDDAIEWRGRCFAPADLETTRTRLALSYGSCSFAEPVDELRALGWLR